MGLFHGISCISPSPFIFKAEMPTDQLKSNFLFQVLNPFAVLSNSGGTVMAVKFSVYDGPEKGSIGNQGSI